uniref:Uncharacterized protein n=2 Tax=Rhodothermus TaxID=29548 RepID=A0A7V2AYR8_RHOMR
MKLRFTAFLQKLRTQPYKAMVRHKAFWLWAVGPSLGVLLLLSLLPLLFSPRTAPLKPLPPSLDSLQVLRQVLEQRLEMAATRQVGLVVDLVEARLALEIGGLPVREVAVSVQKRPLRALLSTQEKPYILQAYRASIPKIPITEVEAPRDTLEAQSRPPILPPPEDSGGVWVYLQFDQGIELWLLSPPATLSEQVARWAFMLSTHLWREGRLLASLLRRQPMPVPLSIMLEMPAADVRAVFRALPDSARLALRY